MPLELQWVLGDVHNGGYWQFFGNSASVWPDAEAHRDEFFVSRR